MSQKKYWGTFGQLNETEAYNKAAENEFQEELLPLEEVKEGGLLDGKTPRRDFLKYLGFSTAAAALAASCQTPVRKAIPYVQRPDNIIPGVADYYASTYVNGGDAIAVVVKQRDGRPIKIDGNELSGIFKGATSARAQASVLDLYNTARLRHPLQKSGNDFKEVPTFEAFDKMVGEALTGLNGKSVVLLTSTVNSPSSLEVIQGFLAKYPGSKHVQYDAVSYSGILLANELSYGKRFIPSYHFDKAKTIVSLGADFLGSWLNNAEFTKQYGVTRKVTKDHVEMSHHIHFESYMSLTGSNADDRFMHKPSETGKVALALLNKLGGGVSAPSLNAELMKGVELAAKSLLANKGQAIVVSGSNDVNVQLVVNAINEIIGANGTTVNTGLELNIRKGIDEDMQALVADMAAGKVGALFVYDCNPVYSYFDGKKFAELLSKVPVSVSFNGTMDETTEQCKYIIPSHHWLESWGDAEVKTNYYSLIQPLIHPLFKTRPFQTSLLKWSGNSVPVATVTSNDSTGAQNPTIAVASTSVTGDEYENFFKQYWTTKLGGKDNYNKALQDGVVEPVSPITIPASYTSNGLSEAQSSIGAVKSGQVEVVFYENVSVGNGAQANNPWLQELPDPITKVTWDNYAMISIDMAKQLLGLDLLHNQKQADAYEVTPEKPVVKVTINGKEVLLPAMIIPGVEPSTIAVAYGYGRESANPDQSIDRVGRSATGAGKNIYPLTGFAGKTIYNYANATVEKTKDLYPLAQTQVHGFTENRPIIYETSLKEYKEDPKKLMGETKAELQMLIANGSKDFVKDATIYPDHVKPGIKWGMSIDLNTCTGCSACVVACIAENNISVVGKTEVARYHDMHWLRIDRYFTGDPNNPDVVFQPMICQHCDNAPCENVCPVAATNHSSEGLNQMAYNRCIGTRYCANNCPYKVRRFNWLDYNGADSFPNNQQPLLGSYLDESVMQMNDDLTRMVLNPDVTVRSRGVMEKCSFCVQRLQEGKLAAKKAEDPSLVRNLKTACAQACTVDAISFGNVNDKLSDVYKTRVEEEDRNFYVLQQLHTLPNVNYLAKLKNTDRHIGAVEEEGHH